VVGVFHARDVWMRGESHDEIAVHDDSGGDPGVRIDDDGDGGSVRQLRESAIQPTRQLVNQRANNQSAKGTRASLHGKTALRTNCAGNGTKHG
jgi:hypothetical protein